MYSILCLVLSFVVYCQAIPAYNQKIYNFLNATTSLSLEGYLQDPSQVYLGTAFPSDQDLQFQLEVSENRGLGTFFGISTVDYDSPKWARIIVDIVFDCSLEDDSGQWNQPLGRSSIKSGPFISAGFTSLTWGELWDVKNTLPAQDNMNLKCLIWLTTGY